MRPSDPSLKSLSDRFRETMYPLAFVLSIGSLWGYAWAQGRVDDHVTEYYPPICGQWQAVFDAAQDGDEDIESPAPAPRDPVATVSEFSY